MVLTHYLLLELPSKIVPCETKEMCGGGGWVGPLVDGRFKRFRCDIVTL